MMKRVVMKFFQFLCLLILPGLSSIAFAQIPVGAWRDHLPYNNVKKVEKIGGKVYCATALNLFTYSIADNSLEKLSRINGLSDIGVSNIGYSRETGILLIAYANGNIDLLKGSQIINIPDLKQKVMTGGKDAGDIFFRGNYAYVCYPFGILVVDLQRQEIKDTYLIGEPGVTWPVNSLTADDLYFYAATDHGVFRASLADPFLVNYERWTLVTSLPGANGRFNHIVTFGPRIIVNKAGNGDHGDTLFVLHNGLWSEFPNDQHQRVSELRADGQTLLVSAYNHLYRYDAGLTQLDDFDRWVPNSALIDENNNLWVGDSNQGLIKSEPASGQAWYFYPQGPINTYVYKLLFGNGQLMVSGGGLDASWNNVVYHGELYIFKDEKWFSLYNPDVFGYTALLTTPSSPQVIYVGSWGGGVLTYENQKVTQRWSYQNSSLQTIVPNQDYVRIGGMVLDDQQNLWVTNSGVYAPLSVRLADGTWKSFSFGGMLNTYTIGDMVEDPYGQFWIQLPRAGGLFVFNPNGTPSNESDDAYLKFKPEDILGSEVSNIFSLAVDKDGYVWVGTDHGPVVYSNPAEVLHGQTSGSQPVIPRNDGTNNVDPSLGTETINCITVDGANRKWFGTEKGGAFLFSPDGTKQIYQFNTENSPILSNTIKSIAINDKTGEVFFGTDKGIISFRAIATEPDQDLSKAYVFPNPVRPGYHGDIIITRLIADTWVKITDISGNLVYQTRSEGGQAIWDGKNSRGEKAASGVYLIFLTNDDGSITRVIKLLLIH